MQFKIGEPISIQLSEILNKQSDRHMRWEVAVRHGFQERTIKSIIARYRVITEKNQEAIVDLCRMVFQKNSKVNRTLNKYLQS